MFAALREDADRELVSSWNLLRGLHEFIAVSSSWFIPIFFSNIYICNHVSSKLLVQEGCELLGKLNRLLLFF